MRALRFIEGSPALFIEDIDKPTLVVSDLHIGLEEELRQQGIYVPSQTQRMISRIYSLCERVGARRLVVLGDIKHSTVGVSPYEAREINNFLGSMVRMFDEVIIVPGNHDGGIFRLPFKGVKVSDPRGIALNLGGLKVAFTHGHTIPPDYLMDSNVVIAGHHHFYIRGVSGVAERYPVWIRVVRESKPNELIIVPAFNELVGGVSLDEVIQNKRRSPILNLVLESPDRTEIYSIQGYYLGPLTIFRAGLEVEDE